MLTAFGLLIEVGDDVLRHLTDALGIAQQLLVVDCRDLGVYDAITFFDGVDVVDPEGENVGICDGIDNGIRMKFLTKRLLGGASMGITAGRGVEWEYRGASEPEEVVVLEVLHDSGMHIAKLGSMALIKDQHQVFPVDWVSWLLGDESVKLLDCGDDDFCFVILQLAFEDSCRGIAVGSSLLESIVFPHRLVVQILSIDDEEHLRDIGELGDELGSLETGQRLS